MDAKGEIIAQLRGIDRGAFALGERMSHSCRLVSFTVWLFWWAVPVLLFLLMWYGYFGYVWMICYKRLWEFGRMPGLALLALLLFNFFFWNALVNFLQAVLRDPGTVSPSGHPSSSSLSSSPSSSSLSSSSLALSTSEQRESESHGGERVTSKEEREERRERERSGDGEAMTELHSVSSVSSSSTAYRRASSSDQIFPLAFSPSSHSPSDQGRDGRKRETETETEHRGDSVRGGVEPVSGGRVVRELSGGREGERELVRCRRCHVQRPPRAHHCRHCKRCILKMDHHCPALNNCVGFANYKYFLLAVLYTGTGCLLMAVVSFLQLAIIGYDSGNPWIDRQVFFGSIFGFTWGLACCILGGTHLWLLSRNLSTLEVFAVLLKDSGPGDAFATEYDLGWRRNFEEVLGDRPLLWPLPVFSSKGNGWSFPVNPTYAPLPEV